MMNTLLYVIFAWFVYAILGFLADAIKNGGAFDPRKFGKSFLWAVIVCLIALFMGIEPVQVLADYGDVISAIVTVLANSGFGIALIYGFDKIWQIISGFLKSIEPKPASTT